MKAYIWGEKDMLTIDIAVVIQSLLVMVIGYLVIRFVRLSVNQKEVIEVQLESVIAALGEMDKEWCSETFRKNYDRHYQQKMDAKRMKIG